MADGDLYLIPQDPEAPHGLGRAGVHHDPLNRAYPALVRPPERSRHEFPLWATTALFDQKRESSCTAQAAVGLCVTQPNRVAFRADVHDYDDPAERYALYRAAQKVDPWPGEEPDYEGTATDAPFKVLKSRGVIESYRWLFGEAEVREYLRWYGPVALGTEWLWDMFNPGRDGFLKVSGTSAGGHAYRLVRYSPQLDAYRMINSWGRSWGQGGRAWIRSADVRRLLENNGDAVTIG